MDHRYRGCEVFQVNPDLEEVGTLPLPQTTDILDQALSVGMGDRSVHVYPDLVDPVDKFTVESVEQILLNHVFLRKTNDLLICGVLFHHLKKSCFIFSTCRLRQKHFFPIVSIRSHNGIKAMKLHNGKALHRK